MKIEFFYTHLMWYLSLLKHTLLLQVTDERKWKRSHEGESAPMAKIHCINTFYLHDLTHAIVTVSMCVVLHVVCVSPRPSGVGEHWKLLLHERCPPGPL